MSTDTPTALPLGTPVVVDQGSSISWTGRIVVRPHADGDGDFCVASDHSEDDNWSYVNARRLTVVPPSIDDRIEAARAALAALEEEKVAAESVTLTISRRDATVLAEILTRVGGVPSGPRGAQHRVSEALDNAGVRRDRRLIDADAMQSIVLVPEWPAPLEPGASTW